MVSLTYHESRELTLEQSVSTNWSNRFFAVCLKILLILYILRLSASKTLGYSKYELHVEQKSFAFELVLISDYFLHFKNQLDCQRMSRHELVSYCFLRYTCRLFPFIFSISGFLGWLKPTSFICSKLFNNLINPESANLTKWSNTLNQFVRVKLERVTLENS